MGLAAAIRTPCQLSVRSNATINQGVGSFYVPGGIGAPGEVRDEYMECRGVKMSNAYHPTL